MSFTQNIVEIVRLVQKQKPLVDHEDYHVLKMKKLSRGLVRISLPLFLSSLRPAMAVFYFVVNKLLFFTHSYSDLTLLMTGQNDATPTLLGPPESRIDWSWRLGNGANYSRRKG
jgi:hypothetical protein